MGLSFGRVRSRDDRLWAPGPKLDSEGAPSLPKAALAPKVVVDAALRAERIVADAQESARQIVARAEKEGADSWHRLRQEARTEAATELAVQILALSEREAREDERALDRVVALSRLLAERLLGETLTLDPGRIATLAETALREARGARRITVLAHPDDVPILERALDEGRLEHVVRVAVSPERARGSLRMESEIGVLDASLGPQLDRLTQCIREGLLP